MFHRHNCEKQPCPCEQLSKHADPGRCPCLVGLASTIGKLDVLPRMRRLVKCSACVSERRSFCSCHSQMRFGATYDLAISQTISSCAKRNATRKKKAYLLSPAQTARVAQVPVSRRPSSPLRRGSCVAVRTVLLQLAGALSSFTLLLSSQEALHFLCQVPVSLLHLSEFVLPACTPCCFQLVENVVFRGERLVLVPDLETLLAGESSG